MVSAAAPEMLIIGSAKTNPKIARISESVKVIINATRTHFCAPSLFSCPLLRATTVVTPMFNELISASKINFG